MEKMTVIQPFDEYEGSIEVHRARGTTLVLVTHDAELAARAESRVSLRDGRIVERTSSPPRTASSRPPALTSRP